MYVFTKNRFGDYVLTMEARLAPGATILVYRDKATVQVYSSRSITGPSKVCVLQVLTETLQLTKLYQKISGTSHKRVVSEFLYINSTDHKIRKGWMFSFNGRLISHNYWHSMSKYIS